MYGATPVRPHTNIICKFPNEIFIPLTPITINWRAPLPFSHLNLYNFK